MIQLQTRDDISFINSIIFSNSTYTSKCIPYFSYNICIRKNAGYSCITYTVCDDTGFSVSNSNGAAKSMTGSDCTADYLEIVGATASQNGNTIINRLCGEVFGLADEGAITTAAAPQVVYGKSSLISHSPKIRGFAKVFVPPKCFKICCIFIIRKPM